MDTIIPTIFLKKQTTTPVLKSTFNITASTPMAIKPIWKWRTIDKNAKTNFGRHGYSYCANTHWNVWNICSHYSLSRHFILIIMMALAPANRKMYLLKAKFSQTRRKVFSSINLKPQLIDIKNYILLAHAFSGCNTTSAIYGTGKKQISKLLHRQHTHTNIFILLI